MNLSPSGQPVGLKALTHSCLTMEVRQAEEMLPSVC